MPNRIVSLEPSVTATLNALGAADRLIAVTKYCKRLTEVGSLPQLETTWSVNAEEVAALEPDLVIAATPYREGKIDELLRHHLDVLCLYPTTLVSIAHHTRMLGALVGAAERAEALAAELLSTVERYRQMKLPARRVYVEMWPNPLMTAERWVKEIVTALGAEFVPGTPNAQVTAGEIIAANPQVIVAAWAGVATIDPRQISTRPGWEAVEAIQQGRVVIVDEIALNAPAPTLIRGMEALAQAIHPERFTITS